MTQGFRPIQRRKRTGSGGPGIGTFPCARFASPSPRKETAMPLTFSEKAKAIVELPKQTKTIGVIAVAALILAGVALVVAAYNGGRNAH